MYVQLCEGQRRAVFMSVFYIEQRMGRCGVRRMHN